MNTKNNIIKIFILLFLSLNLSGCDEVDELTQIDINSTLTEDVLITLSENNAALSESITINLADNSDIEPYLNQIESITVTSASYVIKNYNGIETATGSITINANSEVFGPFQHTFFTDDQNATEFSFDASKLNALSNSLSSNNQLSLDVSGTQDPAQDASLIIEFTLEVEVTAQAL